MSIYKIHQAQEVLCSIFDFCSFQQNIKNIRVCKDWRGPATEVAKKQFIVIRQEEVKKRAEGFLKKVPDVLLETCCPKYFAHLNTIKNKARNLTLSQIYDELYSPQKDVYEKYTVYALRFFAVIERPSASRKRNSHLGHQVCVMLAHKEKGYRKLWSKKSVVYFPIELFKFKVEILADWKNGFSQIISGEKGKGTFCVPLYGTLIEFTLTGDSSFERFPIQHLNTALDQGLSRNKIEIMEIGTFQEEDRFWPNFDSIYDPHVDWKES